MFGMKDGENQAAIGDAARGPILRAASGEGT